MSQNMPLTLLQQITKCKSLQSLHFHSNVAPGLTSNRARPKIQSIRPQNKVNEGQKNNPTNDDEQGASRQGTHRGMLARIRSVDQLNRMRQTASFENIVSLYKKENDNLKQQNKYLMKQIRKRQKNQQVLTNYIQQLRRQIRTLQRSNHASPITSRQKPLSSTKISKKHGESRTNTVETAPHSKGAILIDQGDTWNTMYQIEELNQRFNALMDQCSQETCRKTRNMLRGKLAQTAERMKIFKKQFNLLE